MAWTQFWEGMWYDDATGQTSTVDPSAPPPAPPDPYKDQSIWGFGGQTKALLDQAARDKGIDPASMDWLPYAQAVSKAMGSSTGSSSGGWMLGANDAYIANLILREAAEGTVAGKTDPRFAAQAASVAPDATGANGYYDNQSPIYQQLEQAGVARDESLRKSQDYSQLDQVVQGITEVAPIALAMYGGATGLSGLLSGGAADAASLAAVESTGLGGLSGAGMSAADLAAGTSGLNIFTDVGLENVVTSSLQDVGQVIQQELTNPYTGGDPITGTGEFGELATTTSNVGTTTTPTYTGEGLSQVTGGGNNTSTVTSGGDVDLTGVGTDQNSYNVGAGTTTGTTGGGTTLGEVTSTVGAGGTVAGAAGAGGTDADLTQFGTGTTDAGVVTNTGGGVTTNIGGTSGTGAWNWSDWYKLYQSDPGKALQELMGSSLGNDIKNGLGSLFAYNQNKDYQKDLIGVMNRAIDVSDPFASQRPFYQNELKNMYTDQNYWDNSPILKSMKDNAMRETNASLASQGYNMSGNQIEGLGQTLQRTQAQYALPLINQTGGFAGAGFGPGTAGTAAATTGTAAANAGNAGNMALGNLFNSAWNGVTNPSGNNVSRTGGYMDSNGVWRPA